MVLTSKEDAKLKKLAYIEGETGNDFPREGEKEFIVNANFFFNAKISVYAKNSKEAERKVLEGFNLKPKNGKVIETREVEVYIPNYENESDGYCYGDGDYYDKVSIISTCEVVPVNTYIKSDI